MGPFEIIVLILLITMFAGFLYVLNILRKISSPKNNEDDIEKYDKIQTILNKAIDRSTIAQERIFKEKTEDLTTVVDNQAKDLGKSLEKMSENIKGLDQVTENMKTEIQDFSKVLSADSSLAGKFGEFQLANLLKYHKLIEDVDYKSPVYAKRGEKEYKPDAILIARDTCLVIDSKATADLGVIIKELINEETLEERKSEIKKILKSRIAEQAKELSKKEYQNLVFSEGYRTPQFVIMFIPNENVYLVAKELVNKDTNEIEEGVLLVGPDNMNFIIVMWKHISGNIQVEKQVEAIQKTAVTIHDRFANTVRYFEDLRKSIDATVFNWNKLKGNIDRSLIPPVKKLEDMGIRSSKEIPEEVTQISSTTRPFEKLKKPSEEDD